MKMKQNAKNENEVWKYCWTLSNKYEAFFS